MASFTIYRDSWRRGGDSQVLSNELGDTSLYQARTKMMCCLGQCSFQAGVPLEKLQDVGEPFDVDAEVILVHSGLLNDDDDYGRQSRFSNEAIAINDDSEICDMDREEQLIALAKSCGHTLTFANGKAPWFEVSA